LAHRINSHAKFFKGGVIEFMVNAVVTLKGIHARNYLETLSGNWMNQSPPMCVRMDIKLIDSPLDIVSDSFTTLELMVFCLISCLDECSFCLCFYSPVVTICTASLTSGNSAFCPHSVFMCFVWFSEQTAIISLYSINWLVFITEI
jgi:hypothetical protein